MVAAYPTNIRSFVPRQDNVDLNLAVDINELQEEVTALQTAVGRMPQESAKYPSSTSVSGRLDIFEDDIVPRVTTLEQRMRRAAVQVRRETALQVNSSANWQTFALMPQVVSQLNDFPDPVYDAATGRFLSPAASPGIWMFSATITWEAVTTPAGLRGLALVTSGGTHLAVEKQAAYAGEDQTLQLTWAGRLPTDPAFHLLLRVKQTQGTALFLRADAGLTPCRAEYTHVPG